MTPKLPSLTPKKLLQILEQEGFIQKRQKGSHFFLYHPKTKRVTTIPMHKKELKKGTLLAILRQTGIDIERT